MSSLSPWEAWETANTSPFSRAGEALCITLRLREVESPIQDPTAQEVLQPQLLIIYTNAKCLDHSALLHRSADLYALTTPASWAIIYCQEDVTGTGDRTRDLVLTRQVLESLRTETEDPSCLLHRQEEL